ncbi:glycosyltransferase family 39 protein [Ovoidimarina sediminis]|uniref:glycosyltransferase family 39 protein n=1 Tax=Ovoidimarina sediminis TaxID=3079856 RepID=UPI00290E05B1|nr:glycosyltransferase family 39 protein [Rhodophyticola sp. MJ-SS7]MDU8946134.1 glycosyltransferase family 39 protein [Rhodophyticola sp. MJ-SS7]
MIERRQSTRKYERIDIYISLTTAVVLWVAYPKLYVFSDPSAYLALAHDLPSISQWNFDSPFHHRLGLVAMHWISFQVFGVNEWSAFLPQFLLFSLILICVLQKVSTCFGKAYAIVTLYLLMPQAVTVFPDLGASAFMFLAILGLERRERWFQGAGFASAAFVAFLFKMTAAFVAVPFLIILIADAAKIRRGVAFPFIFYVWTIVTSATLLLLYFAFMKALTGDPLARLNAVEAVADAHLWTVSDSGDLVRRLLIEPVGFFWGYAGGAFLLAIIGSIRAISVCDRDRTIALYFLTGLFLFVFSSVSLSIYQPLPLADRMVAFLIPPLAVLSANLLPHLAQGLQMNRAGSNIMLGCLLFFAVHQTAVPIALEAYYRIKSNLNSARHFISDQMLKDPNLILVLSEPRTASRMNIYFQYEDVDEDRFVVCPASKEFEGISRPIVFIDREISSFLRDSYGEKECSLELESLTREVGLSILFDTSRVFLATKP